MKRAIRAAAVFFMAAILINGAVFTAYAAELGGTELSQALAEEPAADDGVTAVGAEENLPGYDDVDGDESEELAPGEDAAGNEVTDGGESVEIMPSSLSLNDSESDADIEDIEDTKEEPDGLIRVNGELYNGYFLDGDGLIYIVSAGEKGRLANGVIQAGTKYYDNQTEKTLQKNAVYVNGKAESVRYYMDGGKLYEVADGTLVCGTISEKTAYYVCESGDMQKIPKQTVYVSGKPHNGYYMCSAGYLYKVTDGTRKLVTGTILSDKENYYSYNEQKYKPLAKLTVYVSGKPHNGYYQDSVGNLYTVKQGARELKSGTVSAGAKYYSIKSGKYLPVNKDTVYVKGQPYDGYYMCSAGYLYRVTKGSRALKSGTVSSGTKYYQYNTGKTVKISKNTVYVKGKVYDGYYMCSAGYLYRVTKGNRALKSGTVSSGTKYYQYNTGKTVTISKDTVYVNGTVYTGYYMDSIGKMYNVKKGARSAVNGTLGSGTKYYSYNDGRTLSLSSSVIFINGYHTNVWAKINGTWCYFDSKGNQKFKSNVLYNAWSKTRSMSSSTRYLVVVDTSNTKTMVFTGSKGNWVPVYEWLCTPGKPSTPTVKGQFTVAARGYSFGTPTYTCYYYTQFYGDYLFHSIVYNKGTFNVQDGRLGQHLSHGCVRLSLDNAKWIYNNIPRGTKVYVY